MFNQISAKTKLLVPTFGLIIISIFLGSIIIYFTYSKIISLNELKNKIVLSNKISDVLHSLQKERGLSSGYILESSSKFKKELLLERKKSDADIRKLKVFVNTLTCNDFKDKIEKEISHLDDIYSIRALVNKYEISYSEIIQRYSKINDKLLDIVVDISKKLHIPSITQNILAYSNFLYLKEYAGRERAQGVVMFSSKKVRRKDLIRFTNIISIENQHKSMFLKYADTEIKNFTESNTKDVSFVEVQKVREILIYREYINFDVDAKQWFNLITQKLDIYDSIRKFIEEDTSKKIEIELAGAEYIFKLIAFVISLSLFVFVFLLIAFLRLAKQEQRLRVVMDKYIISSITDLKGKIIDVSQAFCNISGYAREELIGKNHNIVRHPDMPKEAFAELWSKITKGESWSGKVKNLQKDGGFYWVYANIEPLFDAQGKIDSYISVRLDITETEILLSKVRDEEEKNKIQQELMQKQSRLAQMGEMLSMIAHQWRQPLSAITAAAGAINMKAKRNKLDNEMAEKLSDNIKDFSIHLSSTIDDFRNFFKSNKTRTEVNYKMIVESVLSIISSSLEKNSIELIYEFNSDKMFLTYHSELKQVVLNLIKNAEDALLENGISDPQILIRAEGNTLSVSDNAGGVPEDIIDDIFNPYFSTKTQKDGTGLGLYMSKIIIEDHCNGSLHVKNDKHGAVFEITLGDSDD